MTVSLSYEGRRAVEATLIACWDSPEETEGAPAESLRTSARILFGQRGVHRVACLCVGCIPLMLAQDLHGRWLDVSGRRVTVRRAALDAIDKLVNPSTREETAVPVLVEQPAV